MDEQFFIEEGILKRYLGDEDVVTIPAGVAAIGTKAFEKKATLQMVIMNEGIEKIGAYAFSQCIHLQAVRFPSTLKSIGMSAFEGCESLGFITLPEGLETIGEMAFAGCTNLKDVKVPSTVTKVSKTAFPNAPAENSEEHYEVPQEIAQPEEPVVQKETTAPETTTTPEPVVEHVSLSMPKEETKEEPVKKTATDSTKKDNSEKKEKKFPVWVGILLAVLVIGAGIFVFLNMQGSQRAAEVSAQIDSIGIVTIDSEPAISSAETGYAELNYGDQQKVTNYQTLVDARKNYGIICQIEKELANFGGVTLENGDQIKKVVSLIDQLPEAERGKYVALRNEIETGYNSLVEEKIKSVEQSIDYIGEVTLTKEHLITAARQNYDSCPADIQKQISNGDVLVAAEEKLAELKEEQAEEAKEKTEEAKKKAEEATGRERAKKAAEKWQLGNYVDEFGDKTGEKFVTLIDYKKGKFSNSATTNSNLLVDFLVDKKNVSIQLYEYGNSLVKNSSSYSVDKYYVTIKDSSGKKTEMMGTIYCGGDRIVIDESYTSTVKNALCGNKSVTFFIQNKDFTTTQYLFEVECSNFKDMLNRL